MWPWTPLTVSRPDSVPRRPFLIMSPSRSTEVGSPTMQASSRLAARLQQFDQAHRAVDRRAFFVAGQQEGDGAGMGRMLLHELFDRHHHRGDRGLHVGRAAAVELAVAMRRHEGVAAPALQRPGGHHVGVAGEDQRRPGPAAAAQRPQVGDAEVVRPADQRLAGEAGRSQPLAEQRLAAAVLGRDAGGGRSAPRPGAARSSLRRAAPDARFRRQHVQRDVGEGGAVGLLLERRWPCDTGAMSLCRRHIRLVGESA